jgi:CheY-like chemotaxis protein
VVALVRALDGDEEQFKQLWLEARAVTSVSAAQEDNDFVKHYLRQVIAQTDWLELIQPDAMRLAFDNLYIPQRVALVSTGAEDNVWAVDDRIQHLVLLGGPGVGKTTTCRALMRRHAIEPDRPVPFLISVREFFATSPPERSVIGYIEHSVETIFQIQPVEGLVRRWLSEGQALVIFDGLDELPGISAQGVRSVIDLFCKEFPAAHVLTTARPVGYEQVRPDPDLFKEYHLLGFSHDQVVDYVNRWFSLVPNLSKADQRRRAELFLSRVTQTPDIGSNPMQLRFACQAFTEEGVLPRSPVTASSNDDRQDDPSRRSQEDDRTRRILVVEDDRDWGRLISSALPTYHVDVATSFHEARELLRTNAPYDAAIVDFNLLDSVQGLDDRLGLDILELLRTEYPSTVRIGMALSLPGSVRSMFDQFGLSDIFIKGEGMRLSDFRNVVRQALARER